MKQSPDRLLQTWLTNADETTGAPNVIDTVHHEVHEGEMYHASYTASVANGANLDLLFTLASKEAHTVFEVFAGGQVAIYLYENPTTTAAGTAVPVYNMKRSSNNTPGAAVTHTPTVTATGTTALVNGRILPGGNSPQTRVGGGVRQGVEWLLAPTAKYLLRVTNTSGSTISVNVALEWYEEEEPGN